jgi:hypothetical protein
VLFFLYLVAGAAHYVVLSLTAKNQRKFMTTIIKEARQMAFGAVGIPRIDEALEANAGVAAAKRRERRGKKGDAGSGESTPQNRRKVTQSNGKSFVVDPSGDVFLLNETEDGTEELLLDPSEIRGARWSDTMLVGLPRAIWNLTLGRFIGKKMSGEEEVEEEIEEAEEGAPTASVPKPKKKGVPAKIARAGEGLPRRRVKGRAPGKAQ